MIKQFNTYEGKLAAQLSQWKAASDDARESEKAWMEITPQFQKSAEKA